MEELVYDEITKCWRTQASIEKLKKIRESIIVPETINTTETKAGDK